MYRNYYQAESFDWAVFDCFIRENIQETDLLYPEAIATKRDLGNSLTGIFITRNHTGNYDPAVLLAIVRNEEVIMLNTDEFKVYITADQFENYPTIRKIKKDLTKILYENLCEDIYSESLIEWMSKHMNCRYGPQYICPTGTVLAEKHPGIWRNFDFRKWNPAFAVFGFTIEELIQAIWDPSYVKKTLCASFRQQIKAQDFSDNRVFWYVEYLISVRYSMETIDEVVGDHLEEALAMRKEILNTCLSPAIFYYTGKNGEERSWKIPHISDSIYPRRGSGLFFGFEINNMSQGLAEKKGLINMGHSRLIPWNKVTRVEYHGETAWTKH